MNFRAIWSNFRAIQRVLFEENSGEFFEFFVEVTNFFVEFTHILEGRSNFINIFQIFLY